MDDQQPTTQLSSIFPGPPPFYKSFTSENLAEFEEVEKQIGDAERDVPEHLRFLKPPLPPTAGTYQCFGGRYEIEEKAVSLEDQGIERLFEGAPTTSQGSIQSQWTLDRATELKKISKSLLLNFLELVGTLSVNPEQYGRKLEDLRTLFINAHYLLNEYRPHQARETLILMMEKQLESTRREVDDVKKLRSKVGDAFQALEKHTSSNQTESMVRDGGTNGTTSLSPADDTAKRKWTELLGILDTQEAEKVEF